MRVLEALTGRDKARPSKRGCRSGGIRSPGLTGTEGPHSSGSGGFHHRFDFHELFHAELAPFAAVTGLLVAAERRLEIEACAVDVDIAGTPAACRISANSAALSGATSEGFKTMVQPAASAGITLQAIWLIGQFHGVIKPHTPIGSRPSSSDSELPSMAVDALLLCGRVSFC